MLKCSKCFALISQIEKAPRVKTHQDAYREATEAHLHAHVLGQDSHDQGEAVLLDARQRALGKVALAPRLHLHPLLRDELLPHICLDETKLIESFLSNISLLGPERAVYV